MTEESWIGVPGPSKLWPALFEVQKEIGEITKNAVNPFYNNKYIPLPELLKVVLPLLSARQILLMQDVRQTPQGPVVVTSFRHLESNEVTEDAYPVVCADPNNPQHLGTGVSYARRYGLKARLAIIELDDDGNLASTRPAQAAQRPAQAPQAAPAPALPHRPASGPQQASVRSQGKGGFQKHPDPVAKEDDAEAVLELALQLDQHGRENPPAGGKSPFQIVKGEKFGIYGKIAERAGVEPGQYSLAQLASRGALPKLRGFYAYLCEQNGLAGYHSKPSVPDFQKPWPDQQEAEGALDLTDTF